MLLKPLPYERPIKDKTVHPKASYRDLNDCHETKQEYQVRMAEQKRSEDLTKKGII